MKLKIGAFAVTSGIMLGMAVFVITYWYLIRGYDSYTLVKLNKIYLGYSMTWYGGLIGLVWGLVSGFIGGALFAWIYNKFINIFSGSREV